MSQRQSLRTCTIALFAALGCAASDGDGDGSGGSGEGGSSEADSASAASTAGPGSASAGSNTGGADSSGDAGDASASAGSGTSGGDTPTCHPELEQLTAGHAVMLSSGGPGTSTGVFCIPVPEGASMITFHLSGGTCDVGTCGSADIVELYVRADDVPDYTNPDDETKYFTHEVGGSSDIGTNVSPGVAYLVTDDGANSLGYQGVSLSIAFDVGGDTSADSGTPGCQAVPELDELACPPGFPPAAYDCSDAVPPPECVPGIGGPEFCCPS